MNRSAMMKSQNDLKKLDVESIIQLAMELIDKHRQEGCNSSLDPGLIAKLNFKLSQAQVHHEESMKYQRLCEQAKHRRDMILGLDGHEEGESDMVDYLRLLNAALVADKQDMKAAS